MSIIKTVIFLSKFKDSIKLRFFRLFSNRDGEYQEKYPNGQLKTKGYYKNGVKEDYWTSYY